MKEGIVTNENICRFLAKRSADDDINLLNFVYECNAPQETGLRCETVYKIHLIAQGTVALQIPGTTYSLQTGDVFFTFPSLSYAIRLAEGAAYMYLSYLGPRANKLMDELTITKKNFLFPDHRELLSLWESAIGRKRFISPLMCEGILLYSFSLLSEKIPNDRKNEADSFHLIKKYVDDHFDDPALSLPAISAVFSYNPKYVSTVFKKKFHVGLLQYITTLRIQKACTLMEQGFTSAKDISFQCGFTDPLYFSKVFKRKMGVSPREHLVSQADKP